MRTSLHLTLAPLLVLAACARTARPAAGAPEWLGPGSGAFEVGSDRRLVGLGVALADGSSSAATVAQARARAEVGPLVDEVAAAIGGTAGGGDEQARAVRQQAQALVEPGPAWEGPDGLVYATATLELSRLLSSLAPVGPIEPATVAAAPAAVSRAFRALVQRGVRPAALPAQAPAAPEPPDEICLVRLDAAPSGAATASCILDDSLADWEGLLRYPCKGGEAEALFGDLRFTGTVERGRVSLSLERAFHFTDGCSWTSRQRLEGELAKGTLSYHYEEQHAPGDHGCEDACVVDREARVR